MPLGLLADTHPQVDESLFVLFKVRELGWEGLKFFEVRLEVVVIGVTERLWAIWGVL